jgi:hypothetical protein
MKVFITLVMEALIAASLIIGAMYLIFIILKAIT